MTARRGETQVRVKRVRGGRVLQVDGTFASWYRPGQAHTGSVWDALAAPLAWLPPSRRRSVLILGLGGGSAARVARAIAPDCCIVGVEASAEVIRVARRWFDLDLVDVEVVRADAHAFLRRTRRRYDYVIDDIFVGDARTLQKPPWLPLPGLALASRCLRPGGLLVSNVLDERAVVTRALHDLFPRTLRIDVDEYDNRILIGGPRGLDARALRAAVTSQPVLTRALQRFSIRRC